MIATAKKETAVKKAPAKKASAKKSAVSLDGRHYDVLQRPVITEKSTAASEHNKVTFKISPTATKNDVKAAVEAIFKVSVLKVNTIKTEGKVKKFKGRDGQRSDVRKAIVTLAAGQSIDLQSAVK